MEFKICTIISNVLTSNALITSGTILSIPAALPFFMFDMTFLISETVMTLSRVSVDMSVQNLVFPMIRTLAVST